MSIKIRPAYVNIDVRIPYAPPTRRSEYRELGYGEADRVRDASRIREDQIRVEAHRGVVSHETYWIDVPARVDPRKIEAYGPHPTGSFFVLSGQLYQAIISFKRLEEIIQEHSS